MTRSPAPNSYATKLAASPEPNSSSSAAQYPPVYQLNLSKRGGSDWAQHLQMPYGQDSSLLATSVRPHHHRSLVNDAVHPSDTSGLLHDPERPIPTLV